MMYCEGFVNASCVKGFNLLVKAISLTLMSFRCNSGVLKRWQIAISGLAKQQYYLQV